VPHVDLGIVFETITYDVIEKTKGFNPSEAPYTYGSLGPGIYFNENETPIATGTTALRLVRPENMRPIEISQDQLATTDEPVLVVRVLRDHSADEIESLASQGNAIATYLLGYMYEFGVGVPLDLSKARAWLEKAAATHTPSGELELGYFLEHHASAPDDKKRALELYEAAAQQNFAKAQAHLAIGLMDGTLAAHTPENHDRGLDLLKRAAVGGYPFAMFALGTRETTAERPNLSAPIARERPGLARPLRPFGARANAEASQWQVQLRRTAGAGNAEASQWLCELSAERGDYRAAVPDCMIAARMGAATAQARLAIAYHDGLGVPKSDYEARHWARLALSQTVLRDDLRSILLSFGYAF
jgi:TPR repeat protein